MDGGDGFATLGIYLTSLNYTLKDDKFYIMCTFPQ